MSDTLTVQDILATESVLTDVETPSVEVLIEGLVYDAETLTDTEDQVASEVGGYEAGYLAFIEKFAEARAAGATETMVREAIQDQAKRSKKRPFVKTADPVQNIDVLTNIVRLDGDLPETWVWRPAAKSSVGVREGEQSVAALVRSVRSPGDKGDLTSEQRKALTGKQNTVDVIDACATKAEAIEALKARRREITNAITDNKKSEAAPKTADKYAKAMEGPSKSLLDALDADLLDDPAYVRATLTTIKANIETALAQASLAV